VAKPSLVVSQLSYGSAELYDPTAGTFTPTASMGTARSGHTATLLNNNKVLIVDGMGLRSSMIPVLGRFRRLEICPLYVNLTR
jgi:hypothetical protein